MSRNCIVQYHVPAENYKDPSYNNIGVNEQLLPYSFFSVKKYAEKIGADYILINEKRIDWKHPTFERFDLFFNDVWFTEYDHILYLDTDLVVWPEAPNIFEMYPSLETFKIVQDRIAERRSVEQHNNIVKNNILNCFDGKILKENRFNAGVFMINKSCVNEIKKYLDYKNIDTDDNSLLIYAMLKSGVKVDKMDWRFNKKNGTRCYFGHAYGQQKFKQEKYGLLERAKETFIIC
jgi:hypothetical protein